MAAGDSLGHNVIELNEIAAPIDDDSTDINQTAIATQLGSDAFTSSSCCISCQRLWASEIKCRIGNTSESRRYDCLSNHTACQSRLLIQVLPADMDRRFQLQSISVSGLFDQQWNSNKKRKKSEDVVYSTGILGSGNQPQQKDQSK